jgi:hypothetical protein
MAKRLWWQVGFVLAVAMMTTASAWAADPSVSVRRLAGFDGPMWPGDFNNDGIVDLVGSVLDRSTPADPKRIVAVALGRGDGSFGPAIRSSYRGVVYGVGDFNEDGKSDVVIQVLPQPDESAVVLTGNGDGTFASTVHQVTVSYESYFALFADFDHDGHLDIALAAAMQNNSDTEAIWLYRGRGDATFEPAGRLITGLRPQGGVVADLDGDSRPDVAVANHYGNSVSVFINQGAFGFASSTIPIDGTANDVTAADVTGDRKVDLVVAVSRGGELDSYYTEGYADVLPGNGDGSFGAAVRYPVERGAWRVVTGDFNRDGRVDIATANRSAIFVDDCQSPLKTWDTLSILPGRGDGSFNVRQSFSIGDQKNVTDPQKNRNTVSSLVVTHDLNRDGHADFVLSDGVVFTSTPPDPNWRPSVSLGPDMTVNVGTDTELHAVASDVDQDMLTYSWTSTAGIPIQPIPSPCIHVNEYGTYSFTVVVSDVQGNTATDTVTVNFPNPDTNGGEIRIVAPAANDVITTGTPYTFRWQASNPNGAFVAFDVEFSSDNGVTYTRADRCLILFVQPSSSFQDYSCTWNNPGPATTQGWVRVSGENDGEGVITSATVGPFTLRTPPGTPPWPWLHRDIGAVGASGTTSFANDVFTAKGAGADIWGTSDAFQYVYRPNPETSVLSNNLEVIARVDSVQNVNAWTKAGIMLRSSLDRDSTHASLFVSPGKGIAFQRRTSTGGVSVHTAGPALKAPVWLRLTAIDLPGCSFKCFVTIVRAYYRLNPTDPWTLIGEQRFDEVTEGFVYAGLAVSSHVAGTTATAAFSNVTVRSLPAWRLATVGDADGSGSITDDAITLQAKGADIWGTADAFEFGLESDGSHGISARVASVSNTNAWTKAGVTIRDFLSVDSAYVMVMVTPGRGIAMQYRTTRGAASAQAVQLPGVAPAWVALTRTASTVTGSYSTDGIHWQTLATVNVALREDALTGVALTSHTTSATATAAFDQIVVEP